MIYLVWHRPLTSCLVSICQHEIHFIQNLGTFCSQRFIKSCQCFYQKKKKSCQCPNMPCCLQNTQANSKLIRWMSTTTNCHAIILILLQKIVYSGKKVKQWLYCTWHHMLSHTSLEALISFFSYAYIFPLSIFWLPFLFFVFVCSFEILIKCSTEKQLRLKHASVLT